jgi:glycosyltransferase involved in cell wall biosynthesis
MSEANAGAGRPLRRLDLLIPELYASDGGVQNYSRNLLKALRQLRPQCRLRVFIRNDHPHHLPDAGSSHLQWHPARGSNLRLSASLLAAGVRRPPDLLLSTHPNFAPLMWLHQRLSGSPSWCAAHGIDVWNLGGLSRCSLAHLQRLLPVSRFSADRLQQQLRQRCPLLTVLPNTYDTHRFRPGPRPHHLLRRYQLRPDQPLILSLTRLGRTERHKNIDALLLALPLLLEDQPELRLMLAGEGDDRPRLQQLARDLGVASQVIFTGRIEDAEMEDHYRLATVFALPSEKEGFGIVFLEAMGCGLPTLGGNRDGSVDPLADGQFGLLVDPRLPLAPPLQALLAGRGDPLWFQPTQLSAAVAEAFGFEAYCVRLDQLLRKREAQLS